MLASKLEAGLVSDCVMIHCGDGKTEAVLNVYNDQYQMVCELNDSPNVLVMADVNSGPIEPAGLEEAEIIELVKAGPDVEPAMSVMETFFVPAEEMEISEAEMVIGVGRGVKDREELRMVADLAGAVGAQVGGTRPAVDAGLIPFAKQIGQTGRIISPNVYLAVGISGARQHILGVEKGKIVAINNDPQAPIFRLADLGVVGDFKEILPVLVRKLREVEVERQS